MTVLVGVRCIDGIIIGADSVATSTNGNFNTMQMESNDKIKIFDNNKIVACTGSVGFAQRLYDHFEAAQRGNVFIQANRREVFTNLSKRFLTDLQNSMAQTNPQYGIGFGSIVAIVHNGQPHLVEYGTKDFQHEEKEGRLFYVSMGSGQILADPFLAFINRVLWKGTMPTLEMGRLGVYWALDHTIKSAPGGVGGKIRIATLSKKDGSWKASEMTDSEEPAQFLNELEDKISQQAQQLVSGAKIVSPLPQPPV